MKYFKLFENYHKYNYDYYDSNLIIQFKIPVKDWVEKLLKKLNIKTDYHMPVGKGEYGFAIDLGDKILKVTNEKSEAYYGKKILNINSPNIVKMFDVKIVKSDYQKQGELYIIVMEKLNLNIDNNVKILINYLHKRNDIVDKLDKYNIVSDEEVYNFFKDKLKMLDKNDILYIFKKWMNVYNECRKYNIPLHDFHSENIGLRFSNNDELVIFDISGLNEAKKYNIDNIETIFLN